MRSYSDPKRADDKWSLPDVEVFWQDGSDIFPCGYFGTCEECHAKDVELADGFGSEQPLCVPCAKEAYGPGFYWWYCFPGCMPDGDAHGPFESEEAALADMRADNVFGD